MTYLFGENILDNCHNKYFIFKTMILSRAADQYHIPFIHYCNNFSNISISMYEVKRGKDLTSLKLIHCCRMAQTYIVYEERG
jgi:hypothetical protein